MKKKEREYFFCFCCCNIKRSKYIKLALTILILTSLLRIILQGIGVTIYEEINFAFIVLTVDMLILLFSIMYNALYLW